ncbi:MAG: hypothetical protein ACRECL_11700 [Bradyrhizobium sp.]
MGVMHTEIKARAITIKDKQLDAAHDLLRALFPDHKRQARGTKSNAALGIGCEWWTDDDKFTIEFTRDLTLGVRVPLNKLNCNNVGLIARGARGELLLCRQNANRDYTTTNLNAPFSDRVPKLPFEVFYEADERRKRLYYVLAKTNATPDDVWRRLDAYFSPDKRENNPKDAPRKPEQNSPSAARAAYKRYMEAYEIQVSPKHDILQKDFACFLTTTGATELEPNKGSVDLRYRDSNNRTVLVEVKPCEPESARYAVRTAIGQLLDYRQRTNEDVSLLIVIGTKPTKEDQLLATSNGFGIAYPAEGKFEVLWPTGAS